MRLAVTELYAAKLEERKMSWAEDKSKSVFKGEKNTEVFFFTFNCAGKYKDSATKAVNDIYIFAASC